MDDLTENQREIVANTMAIAAVFEVLYSGERIIHNARMPGTELSWPEIVPTPLRPPRAIADLRIRSGKAQKWLLPRGERWRERRVPRICWARTAR